MSVSHLFEYSCIHCPLVLAPPCFANGLKELLDTTAEPLMGPRSPYEEENDHSWRGFMKFFHADFRGTAIAAAENAVNFWLEDHQNCMQHTIRRVLDFALARRHTELLERYDRLITRHRACDGCCTEQSDHSLCFTQCEQCLRPQDVGPYPPEPPPMDQEPRQRPRPRPEPVEEEEDNPADPPPFQPSIDSVTGSAVVLSTAPGLRKDVLLYRLLDCHCPTLVKIGMGAIFVLFLALQVLAPLYITVCEDGGVYTIISEGKVSYSEVFRRYLLAHMRLAVRFITPLVFLVQVYLMAKNTHKFYAGRTQYYKELVSSLRQHILAPVQYRAILGSIGWKWMPLVHAVSFAGLLYYLGAFLTAEDRVMGEGLCNLTQAFQISFTLFGIRFNLIMFCECVTVFCILLLTGFVKDSYCLENKIAQRLDSPYRDAIRKRWVLIDGYIYTVSICLSTFALFSLAYGKPFTADAFTNLHAHNVVTWFFWMVFLTVLQFLGLSPNRYVKWGCLVGHFVGYGCITFFLFLIRVENITLPPGSFVLLFYTSISASEFNLLCCLLCTKRGKRAKAGCLACLVSLLLTFCATVFRECTHFATTVLV